MGKLRSVLAWGVSKSFSARREGWSQPLKSSIEMEEGRGGRGRVVIFNPISNGQAICAQPKLLGQEGKKIRKKLKGPKISLLSDDVVGTKKEKK